MTTQTDDQAVATNPKPRTYHTLTPRMLLHAQEVVGSSRTLAECLSWKLRTLDVAITNGARVSKGRKADLCEVVAPGHPVGETWRQLDWPAWKWRARQSWWLRLGLWLRIVRA